MLGKNATEVYSMILLELFEKRRLLILNNEAIVSMMRGSLLVFRSFRTIFFYLYYMIPRQVPITTYLSTSQVGTKL